MLPLQNEVEQLAALAVSSKKKWKNNMISRVILRHASGHLYFYLLKDKETNIVPLPDLVQFNDVWVIL